MTDLLEERVLAATGASTAYRGDRVQSLWSGYGEIVRYHLEGGSASSVIVKHVVPPSAGNHPRGWDTDLSHQRKLRSYEVERCWYADWSRRCGEGCRVPQTLLAEESEDGGWLFVLEDLDAAGFPGRRSGLNEEEISSCLRWLAEFHATFLGEEPVGLWETGTYWHLATRPDELAAIADPGLRDAAPAIDGALASARFQTFVHGDAKVANFCFPSAGEGAVAAVDFQYVGGGCGMKDVAYFLGSCLDERSCEAGEERLLEIYFVALREALSRIGKVVDAGALESEWRDLFPVAWTDFHRFLVGWSPGHWKLTGYSGRLAREVLAEFG